MREGRSKNPRSKERCGRSRFTLAIDDRCDEGAVLKRLLAERRTVIGRTVESQRVFQIKGQPLHNGQLLPQTRKVGWENKSRAKRKRREERRRDEDR